LALLHRFSEAYRTLRTVNVFTGDRVGAVGLTPAHLTAWRSLLADKNAATHFKRLLSTATLPGQLYALAGLYYADRPHLQELAAPYLERADTVPTVITCCVDTAPVREIVTRIIDGAWPEILRRGGSGIELMAHRAGGTLPIPRRRREIPDITPCPYCGQPLRTAKAKQCRHCGKDWH
jgi:hypothetical protein